jgi:hypothetical protein
MWQYQLTEMACKGSSKETKIEKLCTGCTGSNWPTGRIPKGLKKNWKPYQENIQ